MMNDLCNPNLVAVVPFRWGAAQVITLTAVSTPAGTLVSGGTRAIRLAATAPCHVAIAPNTAIATPSATLVSPGVGEVVRVGGGERVAARTATALGGLLSITELSL